MLVKLSFLHFRYYQIGISTSNIRIHEKRYTDLYPTSKTRAFRLHHTWRNDCNKRISVAIGNRGCRRMFRKLKYIVPLFAEGLTSFPSCLNDTLQNTLMLNAAATSLSMSLFIPVTKDSDPSVHCKYRLTPFVARKRFDFINASRRC